MGVIDALTMEGAGQALGNIIDLGFGNIRNKRQLEQNKKLLDQNVDANMRMSKFNMQQQLEMWKNTSYGAQMEQLKKAGLNPGLLYGMGGGGGQTTGSTGGGVSGAVAQREQFQAAQGMGMQLALLNAQKENIEADTANKKAQVPNTEADTANKILDGVIKDYTGKEAKAQFEDVKQPNRLIEAKTYQDELEARQGTAGTIYELWVEGKLKEKSVEEIEQILLQNAKTRAEKSKIYKDMELLDENIKGAKLDNIIRDLETKLQTQTGIDKNSPTWLKVLGRLFVTLFNK